MMKKKDFGKSCAKLLDTVNKISPVPCESIQWVFKGDVITSGLLCYLPKQNAERHNERVEKVFKVAQYPGNGMILEALGFCGKRAICKVEFAKHLKDDSNRRLEGIHLTIASTFIEMKEVKGKIGWWWAKKRISMNGDLPYFELTPAKKADVFYETEHQAFLEKPNYELFAGPNAQLKEVADQVLRQMDSPLHQVSGKTLVDTMYHYAAKQNIDTVFLDLLKGTLMPPEIASPTMEQVIVRTNTNLNELLRPIKLKRSDMEQAQMQLSFEAKAKVYPGESACFFTGRVELKVKDDDKKYVGTLVKSD